MMAGNGAVMDEEEEAKAGEKEAKCISNDGLLCGSSSLSTSSSISLSASTLLSLEFIPLSLEDVAESVEKFKVIMQEIQSCWDEESSKYEEFIGISLLDGEKIPRRNYANPQGIVEDPTLFPYHSSCYALLDAYDCLYEYGGGAGGPNGGNGGSQQQQQQQQPIAADSILPRVKNSWNEPKRIQTISNGAGNEEQEQEGDGGSEGDLFVLSSLQSIMAVLFERHHDDRNSYVGGDGCDDPGDAEVLCSTIIEKLMCFVQEHSKAPLFAEDKLRQDSDGWNIPLTVEDYSPSLQRLPTDPGKRRDLLLRLLKHSLSELQRDHMLGSAILARLAMDGSFNHVPTFCSVLAILCSEYVICRIDNDCDAPEDHDCYLWRSFINMVVTTFCLAPDWITHEHAVAMAGFGRFVYLREFGHLLHTHEIFPTNNNKGNKKSADTDAAAAAAAREEVGVGTKPDQLLRLHLKRFVLHNRMEESADLEGGAANVETPTPTRLLLSLVIALGKRGERELARIDSILNKKKEKQEQDNPSATKDKDNEDIARCLDSYYNCLKSLVSLAYSSVQILPKSQRLYQVASVLVRSITATLIHIETPCEASESVSLMDHELTYYLGAPSFPQLESFVTSPLRLASKIRNATNEYQTRKLRFVMDAHVYHPSDSDVHPAVSGCDWSKTLRLACEKALYGQPHGSIQAVVRSMFLRDAVYMTISGLGYGDFLLWCRFPIQPLDPVLYYHDCNHITPDDIDDHDDEDEEDEDEDGGDTQNEWEKPVTWAQNENGYLDAGELWCHFNFSLLAMVCAYQEPWNPASHMSFNPKFRIGAKTLLLCLERKIRGGFPKEVLHTIISFLPRDFWPEEEFICWQYECALRQTAMHIFDNTAQYYVNRLVAAGESEQQTPQKPFTCKRCHIPRYCSKLCREADFKEMHKRICIEPPYCEIGKEHVAACKAVEDGSYKTILPIQPAAVVKDDDEGGNKEDNNDGDDDDGDGDDDESWESVDSDEEEAIEDNNDPISLTEFIKQFMLHHRKSRSKN